MRKIVRSAFLTLLVAAMGCEEPALLSTTYALCAGPERLSFGDQTVQEPTTRDIVVSNCGSARIDQISDSLSSPDFTFTVVATDVPLPLSPGQQFTLPVRFRPKTVGPHAATLSITAGEVGTADVARGVTLDIPLEGNGVPLATCDVLAGPNPVEFGAVLLDQFVERDVTFTNQGTAACALSGARVTLEHDEFFEITLPPPAEVPPGGSVTTTIRFSPREVGAREGRLAVVVDGASEIDVALFGTGVSPDRCALEADPSPLALPRASLGLAPTEGTALVRSVGELACTISSTSIVATGNAGDFTLVGAPLVDSVLAPGDAVPLTVRFAPLGAGPRTGGVAIATAEDVTLDLPLSGFADPAPTCALVFDPATVSFSPLAVGLSAEADVSFQNVSSIPCTLVGVDLAAGSEPDFAIVNAPATGTVLEPASVQTARVRFTPQLAAPALGRLELSLSGGVTSSVDLLGFGDFAELVLVPGLVTYGIVTQGCVSDTVELTLTNVGPVAARIDDIGFTPATDPNFELVAGGDPLGALLAPGAQRLLRARMHGAEAAGPHSGALEVRATGTRDAFERADVFGATDTVENAARTDTFTQRERPIVDILFVIDNSGSMGDEQANLAQNFGAFIQFTTELDIDYQIGVVTTEGSGSRAGVFEGPIIKNAAPGATPDPIAEFVAQANVGTNGSADEEGLNAAVLALTEPRISSPPNAGFVRDGALLSVIFVSDEEDHSPGDVAGYLDALLGVKDHDADAVLASAIAGDVPSGCSSPDGDADAARRYLDVVTALEGVFASICAADWATTMEQIGVGTFEALTRFQLSREPDPDTVVVTVDGVVVPNDELNGWTYDPATNSVRFHGSAIPEAGDQIDISYVAECILPGGAP